MAFPSSPGGGKRRSTPSHRSSKKTSNEDDDDAESQASDETSSNSFGFLAYSNPGEKPWVKIKNLTHHLQPAYSNTSRSDRAASLSLSSNQLPSPRKLRCLEQRESQCEEKHEHRSKKRRVREVTPNSPLDLLWLG